jgi:LacI family transcriptional regulator
MTRYLASLGHRRIAFVAGSPDHKAVANRFDGYRDGLEQSGLPFADALVAQGDNSIGSGEACAEYLLSLSPRPTAVFAANDDMAAGVIRVATRLGIKMPEELSVAGFDDISLARQIIPSLTTIHQPLRAMARAASDALIDGSRGRARAPELEIIPAIIQVRDSTGPAPEDG